ncbi:MAG: hypothetical protein QM758_13225 [Armatimonas sp.]
MIRRVILLVLALFALTPLVRAQGVWASDCFPIEKLPTELRSEAEQTLWKLLDSEALYTVVGGLKPMSGGFVSLYLSVEEPDRARLEALSKILSALRCGDEVECALMPFATVREGKRYAEAVVFRRSAMTRMLTTYPELFAPYGFAPATASQPLAVALSIEHDLTSARNRGLGYLYGYPKSAVDFFVTSQDEYMKTKVITPRDFFQIPTVKSDTGTFVYAIPKGRSPSAEDLKLKERAGKILAEYRKRRVKYFGSGKHGPAALLREWFQGADGMCSPENAKF